MSIPTTANPTGFIPASTPRFLVRALLLVSAAVLIGILPLRAWAGADGVRALLFAAGSAYVGAAAARLPRTWILRSGRPEAPLLAAMAGIGIRMLVTASLALGLILAEAIPPLPFAVALVVIYLALVVLEVREATKEVSRMNGVAAR